MTPSAAASPIKTAPKSPDTARRHYVTLAWRLRAKLAEARTASSASEDLDDLAERLTEARDLAGRARSWARRAATRARLAPVHAVPAGRRRQPSRPVPITAREREIEVGERSVPDPYAPGSFTRAPVNRRVDILAKEHAAGFISDAQFQVGRMIQAIYERGSGARLGSRGWEPCGSRDRTVARELAVIYALEDANRVIKFTARLERAIGAVGTRFLRAILAEGHTFTSYAAARGKSGERGTSQIATHFRFLLEGLTEAQHTATGAGRTPIQDTYRQQADELGDRLVRLQAAAEIEGAMQEEAKPV